jgi:hypothetical protein
MQKEMQYIVTAMNVTEELLEIGLIGQGAQCPEKHPFLGSIPPICR